MEIPQLPMNLNLLNDGLFLLLFLFQVVRTLQIQI